MALTTVSALALASALAAGVIWSGTGQVPRASVAQDYALPRATGTWHHRIHPTATAVPTTPASPGATTPAPTTPAPPPTSAGDGGGVLAAIPTVGLPVGILLHTLGTLIITQAGTVIDGADILGGVTVRAPNVVIRRSRISGIGGTGIYVASGSLTLEDSTVSGFDDSVGGDNYTATRVEVTGSEEDGFKIGSNVTIQDSWCHDLLLAQGAHSDCGQVQSGVTNVMIRRNWFDVGDGNSALFLAPDQGPSSSGPLVVEDNVLGGGNYTLQCVDGDDGTYFIDNISISGNHFLNDSAYGPLRLNVPAAIIGNVYQSTGLAIDY